MFSYKNKVAIVTGAAGGGGGGTGRRIAELLAQNGAKVVLTDISPKGEEAAAEIVKNGGEAIFVQADLGDESTIKALMEKAIATYGKLDVVVNCAFFQVPEGYLLDTPIEIWDKHFQINMRGNFLMAKYTLPHLIENGGGCIVNISSTASIRGEDGAAAYAACKAGLNSLTRSIAAQYADKKIRCNAILPGVILSDSVLERSQKLPALKDSFEILKHHTLVNRFGKADDIANMVLYLASDEASYVTGQQFVCDGGYSSHSAQWADVHDYKKDHEWGII
ncbi:MAG: SDR family oxidoreductase [Oscillospiraceae bacterium]